MHEDIKAVGLVLLASLLAGLVGLEREREDKPAGFRTHMFIGGAAALLIILGDHVAAAMPGGLNHENVRLDPLRLIEAIIVGVSFIGSGTILKSRSSDRVRNLTSAATLLYSAAIGICVAVEHYILATGVVAAALVINVGMKHIESRWLGKKKHD